MAADKEAVCWEPVSREAERSVSGISHCTAEIHKQLFNRHKERRKIRPHERERLHSEMKDRENKGLKSIKTPRGVVCQLKNVCRVTQDILTVTVSCYRLHIQRRRFGFSSDTVPISRTEKTTVCGWQEKPALGAWIYNIWINASGKSINRGVWGKNDVGPCSTCHGSCWLLLFQSGKTMKSQIVPPFAQK